MQLLFLRHGPAESRHDWSGDDEDRPLTAEGKLVVTQVACSLPAQGTRPDLILTSPLARAQQTAAAVAECLGLADKFVVDKRLAPGFGQKQLDRVLRDYADNAVLMLVGHEPDFSQLVRELTGGGRLAIRKGGLAQVEIMDPKVMKGRLVSLLVPTSANPQPSATDADS